MTELYSKMTSLHPKVIWASSQLAIDVLTVVILHGGENTIECLNKTKQKNNKKTFCFLFVNFPDLKLLAAIQKSGSDGCLLAQGLYHC